MRTPRPSPENLPTFSRGESQTPIERGHALAIRSFAGRSASFGAISKFEGCKRSMGKFRWLWLLWTSADD